MSLFIDFRIYMKIINLSEMNNYEFPEVDNKFKIGRFYFLNINFGRPWIYPDESRCFY